MELRELAERVLFSTSLEEKLQCPAVITDAHPGMAMNSPVMPGRPRKLIFKPTGTARGEFPGTQHLEKEQERGRLLHFFANHELLATELMALVLLKFPDAPAAFRKGVLETLKDEQEHTRLYLERMKGCGIQFGDLPVSGYFWRAVSGMENPIDYVAGLSLTFEQANLDFAGHFSTCFAEVGDADSAKLLHKIYRDEIGHVAYGLKWFRRWKNPSESDWEAFCRHLKFPLSPSRAKGFSLNVEGRRAAGLDADFIERLNVFSQSKGRTPTVFVFNPLAEARIARGKGFSPTKHQVQLVRDLANLPQFLCRQDDVVIVEHLPSVHFLSGLKEAGFTLPEFVELDRSGGLRPGSSRLATSDRAKLEIGAPAEFAALTQRKLGGLRPWAWGPDSVELFRPLFARVTVNQRPAERWFNEHVAALYSKAWSADLLRRLLPQCGAESWLCPADVVGLAVDTVAAAEAAIAEFRFRGHRKLVLKESVGLAGSNALRLFENELLTTQRRWIANVVASGRQLVIEPWLERELDFSVQLEMTPNGLRLCGYTGLLNDAKGQFLGNWAEPWHDRQPPAGVLALLKVLPTRENKLQRLYTDICATLEVELRRVDFLGPLGIDAFIYRNELGERLLKPIVEINPRYTMGRVMVELMKRAGQGCSGLFRLINRPRLRADGFADFAACDRRLREQYPMQYSNEPSRRIIQGAISLNDPAQAQVCLAVFQVFKTAADLQRCAGLSATAFVKASR